MKIQATEEEREREKAKARVREPVKCNARVSH